MTHLAQTPVAAQAGFGCVLNCRDRSDAPWAADPRWYRRDYDLPVRLRTPDEDFAVRPQGFEP